MRYKFLMLLMLLPILSHAEWMSEVDQKYQARDPALYAIVLKNKKIIDKNHENKPVLTEVDHELQSFIMDHPDFAPAYVQKARVNLDLNKGAGDDYDGAAFSLGEMSLRHARILEPHYDYALVMMGFINLMHQDYQEAEDFYQQAIDLHSGYPYLYLQMAKIAYRRGESAKQISELKMGLEQNKADPVVMQTYLDALMYAYYGSFPPPVAEVEVLTKMSQTLPGADPAKGAYYQGYLELYFKGDVAKAIQYGERSLALGNFGENQYFLAAAYYIQWAKLVRNQSQSAKVAFKKAEALMPLQEMMIDQLSIYGHGHYKDIREVLLTKLASQEPYISDHTSIIRQ